MCSLLWSCGAGEWSSRKCFSLDWVQIPVAWSSLQAPRSKPTQAGSMVPTVGLPPARIRSSPFPWLPYPLFFGGVELVPPLAPLRTRSAALPGAPLGDLLGSTRRMAQLLAEHYRMGSGPRLPVGGGAGEGHHLLAITVALCETLRSTPWTSACPATSARPVKEGCSPTSPPATGPTGCRSGVGDHRLPRFVGKRSNIG